MLFRSREISELADTLDCARKELSKVEGLRRELIANVSHDLRTPLTMIAGYAEMMRDIPDENKSENVQIIIDEAQRLSVLVNDLLDISKMEEGTGELVFETIDLTQTVQRILTRYTKLVSYEGYKINFSYDRHVFVKGDALRLGQVIYNLLNNAINYTGSDKYIEVRQTMDNGYVKISVIDSGEGIPKEQMKYIWERYYKVDKTHKRASIGTGLGLSIVRKILIQHQAEYGVVSAEGTGSEFWFALPVTMFEANRYA